MMRHFLISCHTLPNKQTFFPMSIRSHMVDLVWVSHPASISPYFGYTSISFGDPLHYHLQTLCFRGTDPMGPPDLTNQDVVPRLQQWLDRRAQWPVRLRPSVTTEDQVLCAGPRQLAACTRREFSQKSRHQS